MTFDPGGHMATAAPQPVPGGRYEVMDEFIKLLMFMAAVYGAYQSVKTAWRLGAELFG